MPVDLCTIHDDPTLLDRIGTKFTAGDECWIWHGAKDTMGYGQIWANQRVQYAHRVLYELLVGPIPEGLQLDHLCRVPACVRPAHCEPVTMQENIRRGNKTGPKPKSHCRHGHELTPENLLVSNGRRRCRVCNRDGARRRYQCR